MAAVLKDIAVSGDRFKTRSDANVFRTQNTPTAKFSGGCVVE
jgi:hypothetical protein